LSAFAHTLQAPVPLAPPRDYLFVDSRAIVPNSYSQKTFGVRDLRFDFGRLRMAESILQRLPSDAINVVAKDRMQFMWFALYRDMKFRGMAIPIGSAKFLSQSGDRLS
jgi:hypothetical protein